MSNKVLKSIKKRQKLLQKHFKDAEEVSEEEKEIEVSLEMDQSKISIKEQINDTKSVKEDNELLDSKLLQKEIKKIQPIEFTTNKRAIKILKKILKRRL